MDEEIEAVWSLLQWQLWEGGGPKHFQNGTGCLSAHYFSLLYLNTFSPSPAKPGYTIIVWLGKKGKVSRLWGKLAKSLSCLNFLHDMTKKGGGKVAAHSAEMVCMDTILPLPCCLLLLPWQKYIFVSPWGCLLKGPFTWFKCAPAK